MKLRICTSRSVWLRVNQRRISWGLFTALLVVFPVAVATASSRDVPIAAVVLFDNANGPAYIQLTGVMLNGRTEVRVCDGVSKLTKNAYGNLPRIPLKGASSLERGSDGVLTLTVNDKSVCVVPGNVVFDKKSELTPSEAADQAVLQGTPVVASSPSSLELKPNMQVTFVAGPDVELAEFLGAKRANSIRDWRAFIAHAPSSRFLPDARNILAALHQNAAELAFRSYQNSKAAGNLEIAKLREASIEAQAASQTALGFKPSVQLSGLIEQELNAFLETDRAKLQDFRRALQQHAPGYAQLASARLNLDQLVQVRSDYAPLLNLQNEVAAEQTQLDATVSHAESLAATGRHDDAVSLAGPYVSFSSEIPRIDALIEGAYKYHLKRGRQAAADQEWEQACIEFRKATLLRPNNKEAESSLADSTIQLSAQHDQQAANIALTESKDLASKGQIIEAYNVLADLPTKPRAQVAPQLAALSRDYVAAAVRRAQKLQDVHVPIKVRADEDAIREAYLLLDRASSLSSDPAVVVKRDFLSSKISAYYLDQANRYLEKPEAANVGIGWLYLQEAQRYGITNLDSIKDRMSQFAPQYHRRARLSIGLILRDQTSRNEGPGFADQISDSIASGLESSGIPIEVVRKSTDDNLQPSFILAGEILDHRVVKNSNLDSPLSRYRAGTHEAKNPAWVQAKGNLDSAQQELTAAQRALSDAQSQHRKKEIAADNDALEKAQKRVDELEHALEVTEPNRIETVLESYHYSKKTVDLSALIDLTFHIVDRMGSPAGPSVEVRKANRRTVVLIQDVKPEDVDGFTNQGVEPNEIQFLTDLEIEARNAVVEAVANKALELPRMILQNARRSAQQGDLDGTAEQYILYLNSTAENDSAERAEALKFLHDRFNLDASSFASSGRVLNQSVTTVSSTINR